MRIKLKFIILKAPPYYPPKFPYTKQSIIEIFFETIEKAPPSLALLSVIFDVYITSRAVFPNIKPPVYPVLLLIEVFNIFIEESLYQSPSPVCVKIAPPSPVDKLTLLESKFDDIICISLIFIMYIAPPLFAVLFSNLL